MIPYLLAIAGGYLIGQNLNPNIKFVDGGNIEENDEEYVPRNMFDMVGKWDDLIAKKNSINHVELYFKIPKGKTLKERFNAEERILNCIINNGYDYYLLDKLMSEWRYKNHINDKMIDDIIIYNMENKYDSLLNLITDSYINYIGEKYVNEDGEYINGLNKEILRYCVAQKCLKANMYVIDEALSEDEENLYLKIVGDVSVGSFNDYVSAEDVLSNLNKSPYIEEYSMLSLMHNNDLYDIYDEDIDYMIELYKKHKK